MHNDPIGMSEKWDSNYDSCLLYTYIILGNLDPFKK